MLMVYPVQPTCCQPRNDTRLEVAEYGCSVPLISEEDRPEPNLRLAVSGTPLLSLAVGRIVGS
jgi:hypothetical protein